MIKNIISLKREYQIARNNLMWTITVLSGNDNCYKFNNPWEILTSRSCTIIFTVTPIIQLKVKQFRKSNYEPVYFVTSNQMVTGYWSSASMQNVESVLSLYSWTETVSIDTGEDDILKRVDEIVSNSAYIDDKALFINDENFDPDKHCAQMIINGVVRAFRHISDADDKMSFTVLCDGREANLKIEINQYVCTVTLAEVVNGKLINKGENYGVFIKSYGHNRPVATPSGTFLNDTGLKLDDVESIPPFMNKEREDRRQAFMDTVLSSKDKKSEKQPEEKQFIDTNIDFLPITPNCKSVLKKYGLNTLEDAYDYLINEQEKIPGIGETTIDVVRRCYDQTYPKKVEDETVSTASTY